ncbi:MAG: hypothetical protein IT385_14145 [Deltaproteobacteria bacterium]|nr:hypothetical protein [Deltaproteobacteria bacterium]
MPNPLSRRARLAGLLMVLPLGLFACGGKGGGAADYPAGPEGGKQLVTDLMTTSDKAGLIKKLEPTKADLEALFDGASVAAVEAHVAKMYAGIGEVGPKEGQTEVVFHAATTEDFAKATDAAQKFPGGYGRVAAKLKPGITWYAWKYVKPGETLGMAFDGLTHVNGRWVWVPKPFRALMD